MSLANLEAAAACAAWLMGAAPVLPDEYVERAPTQAQCRQGGTSTCRGAFIVRETGRTVIRSNGNFSNLIHESCHAIQHAQGRFPVTSKADREAECRAVQSRAAECFQGMGAPGMLTPSSH